MLNTELNTELNTASNTVSIYDLNSKLATAQANVQHAVERISKYYDLPESDPKRQTRIRLAYVVLDHHSAAQRRLEADLERLHSQLI